MIIAWALATVAATGIAVAAVSNVADQMTSAMGGRLDLWDTPGGGLTAVVTLPSAEASSEAVVSA